MEQAIRGLGPKKVIHSFVKSGARRYRGRSPIHADATFLSWEKYQALSYDELIALLRKRMRIDREGIASGHWAFRFRGDILTALRSIYVAERLARLRDRAVERAISQAGLTALAEEADRFRTTVDGVAKALSGLASRREGSLPQEHISMSDEAFRLAREVEAAKVLRDQFKEAFGDDADAIADTIEGETSLFEKVEALIESIANDNTMIAALKMRTDDLAARKERFVRRVDMKRAIILTALQTAEVKKREFASASVGRSSAAMKAIVTEEADVPTLYFEQPAPKLSQSKVNDYYRPRFRRLKEIDAITDPAERRQALEQLNASIPELPGVTVSNGGESLTLSWK